MIRVATDNAGSDVDVEVLGDAFADSHCANSNITHYRRFWIDRITTHPKETISREFANDTTHWRTCRDPTVLQSLAHNVAVVTLVVLHELPLSSALS